MKGTKDYLAYLSERIAAFKNGKGYELTMDNYVKITRIHRKAQIRIPIIICGETGCGKTHLVDFVSSCLLNDEFKCFTLNSGTT